MTTMNLSRISDDKYREMRNKKIKKLGRMSDKAYGIYNEERENRTRARALMINAIRNGR